LCGYAESCTGRVHDAALLVDGRGCALANYRRVHLAPETDEPRFAPGAWLNVAVLGGRRVGLLLGADVEGPETARSLALAGAEVLLVAARHGPAAAAAVDAVLPARAAENRCALAYANREAGPGAPPARLVAPDGAVLAAAGDDDGLTVATVPLAGPADRRERDLLRRPRLYQRLVAPMPDEDGPRL
jgi:predicted amidohydrolase